MSKPQWKLDLEAKERAVQEREEAEKRAKAQKLASLGHASGSVDSAPVHISEVRLVPHFELCVRITLA